MLGIQDANGQTPLHQICYVSRTERSWRSFVKDSIKFMVEKYPDALQVRDIDGDRPIDVFRHQHRNFPCGFDQEEDSLIAEAAMVLMTGHPNETKSLHFYLSHSECTPDLARFFIVALQDQLSTPDENGDLPLHIVASRPLLAGDTQFHHETVELLLRFHPDACRVPNRQGDLPLTLMARAGKGWESGMGLVFQEHPPALSDLPPMNGRELCELLRRTARDGEPNGLFHVLKDIPNLLQSP